MTKDNVQEAKKDFYNFIIIGAGPAGLTSGIVAVRNGFNAIIIEKGERAGPKPRGEGMAHSPIVDDILGKDFLPSIGLKSNGGRVWHSPGDIQITTTYREDSHYFFEWRKFIDRLVDVALKSGVKILLKSEVIKPIEQDGFCIGVQYKAVDENKEILGNSILDCSGHSGIIGSYYNIPYEDQINCPIVKCLISEANIDIIETPDLQFYFIGNGDLEYSPYFPQCVAYVFPLGNNRAEVGLMLRIAQARGMKTVKIPSDNEIMMVWDNLKKTYPGFNVFFKGAKTDYEELTALSNAKMVEAFVPKPGVVLIGDSAGFVDPFGSSGLVYSMEMANFWVNMLSKKLKSVSGGATEVTEFNKDIWHSNDIDEYNKEFEGFKVYEHIRASYNLIGAFEYKIFRRLRTAEKINNKWDYITSLLKQA